MTVKPSSTSNARLGVYATQSISPGVRFGPYKGQKISEEDLPEEAEDTSKST